MFDSAAEFARECGVHRTTVAEWIKKGEITARKGYRNEKRRWKPRRRNQHYKIHEKNIKKIKELKPPYPKYYKPYTETEIYMMINNKHLSNKKMAEILERSENSVCIKRCRLRKEGYDV